jgi:SulP family sulfate permease
MPRPVLGDLVAGASVAVVLMPQSLAYAEVAGMPPHRGLYAAALPPVVAAFLASSPYLQTGPVAITALLTFGALSSLAPAGSPEYVDLGLLLALVVGVVRVAMGLLRAGVVTYLMSQPMLMGFTPAAAVLIVLSQVPSALGVEQPRGDVVGAALRAAADPWAWRPSALAMCAGVALLVVGGRKLHRLFPGVLVAVGLAIAFTLYVGYGGPVVGLIPEGLPPITLDLPWETLPQLLLPGAVIALVGFAEPASIARAYATQERARWNPNREFVSQGAANVAAAFSGGFPVGGSFSRSSLNRMAGARTRWSGAVTGLCVLAFLPFAGVLAPLPRAVLGAIVIVAAAGLVRLGPAMGLWRLSKPQWAVAWTTFALTLVLSPHVERAVIVGIALAVAIHLWRELSIEVEAWREGEAVHLRPRGVLWFATASGVEDAMLRELAHHPDAACLVVHVDGLGRVDLTGALALRSLRAEAEEAGLTVRVEGDAPERSAEILARVLGRP